jgi:RNA polymerase sporulation-specific sigma factor
LKAFLKPLGTKEESEYLRQCREGNLEARAVLIERNLRLVAHIAKKYAGCDYPLEDLISIGTIGLIKAIDSFDIEKEIRLATYASRCIDNELLMLMRSSKKQSREVYLYEPIGTDKDGSTLDLLDILEAEEPDVVEQIDLSEKIEKLYELLDTKLTKREREILYLRYGLKQGKEITQKEIGERMGISRSYVSRIEKKALKKLRDCYE